MKAKYYLFLCFLYWSIACSTTQKNKSIKTLDPVSNSSLEVAKNEIFYYKGKVHSSVGIEIDYAIEDRKIVQFHHWELDYKNKEKMQEGMSGADEAIKTLAFESKEVGKTNITIREFFRGEVQNTYTFKITVK